MLFYSLLHANKRNSVYETLKTLQNVHRNNNNNNNIIRDNENRNMYLCNNVKRGTCMLIGVANS